MKNPELFDEKHEATYCPEDNKLRLYVGRVPRDEYEALRAEGWTSTPKQDCDFVAVWTVVRKNTCISYAGIIGDEDQSPQDRAADRAERFSGYLDKRLSEAEENADRYDEGPSAHGYQNARKAERAAARHDRHADRALDSWRKAEYWQRRTAGVISNALYLSRPDVRMRRIKKIESEKRKAEKTLDELTTRFCAWEAVANDPNPETATAAAAMLAGRTRAGYYDFKHPRSEKTESLYRLLDQNEPDPITGHEAAALMLSALTDPESQAWKESRPFRFLEHCELRLAYEWQMLKAAGGRAEQVEIEKAGKIGNRLIWKVSKSTATGRANSVKLIGPKVDGWAYRVKNIPHTDLAEYYFKLEEFKPEDYTPPTDESRAELAEIEKTVRDARKKAPKSPSLINPTDDDAERLQTIWNKRNREEKTVMRITQAEYSHRSKGSDFYETVNIAAGGNRPRSKYFSDIEPTVCKVRQAGFYGAVIVLTDKPQKPLPAAVFANPDEEREKEVQSRIQELVSIAAKLAGSIANTETILTESEQELFRKAVLIEYAYESSLSQRGLTRKGDDFARKAGAYSAPPEKTENEAVTDDQSKKPETVDQSEGEAMAAEKAEPVSCPWTEGDLVKVTHTEPGGITIKGAVFAVYPVSGDSGKFRVDVMETWSGEDRTAKAYTDSAEWRIESWNPDEERNLEAERMPTTNEADPVQIAKAQLSEKLEQMQLL